ncbi:MAG: NAD(P)-dependent alcohol dehydrogenase [Deltaproteobacteria bacterium]|nr:NAD(P)-dependent alcohol dehydrogenase [Deltaproteobacteria bacterium]
MRAWSLSKFGFEGLELSERPDPRPGPGQVLVEMKAWSLNARDLRIVEGSYNPRQRLPLVPLSDGAGVVLETGPGVQGVAAGDRVVSLFFQGWPAGRPTRERLKTALASPLDGVLAERVVLEASGIAPAPKGLSDAEAATLPCAGLTAWSALELAGTTSGDVVVTQGSGGVSVLALLLAKARNARVIATSRTGAKADKLRAVGADLVIATSEVPDWGTSIKRKLTDGGADHVVEVGGAGTLAQSIEAVRPDGVVSIIGVMSGFSGPLSLLPVLMQNIRLQGVIVGSRDGFLAMSRAIEAASLRPPIDVELPFEAFGSALVRMRSGEHFGKIVLRRD